MVRTPTVLTRRTDGRTRGGFQTRPYRRRDYKRLPSTRPSMRIPDASDQFTVKAMKAAAQLALAAVLLIWASICACAQEESYPTKPIRIIVPFPAGGPSDIVARLIGHRMSEDWKQPVLIENRPGANTIIGAQAAAKAPPDGYTLFIVIDSAMG